MFCKYCGRKLKEGETCNCRQAGNHSETGRQEPKKPAQVMPEQNMPKPSVPKQTGEGKGLLIFSFCCSVCLLISFILLRIVLQDTLGQSVLEGVYPYLIYIVPFVFGALALMLAVFSLQNKQIRTLSVTAILVSLIFTGGVAASLFLFPYEPDTYTASDDEEETEEEDRDKEKDTEKDTKQADGSEERTSFTKIKADYKSEIMDYAQVKNALGSLDVSELKEGEEDELLDFQTQIEKDLKDELAELAAASDYKKILTELSRLEEETEEDDQLLEELHEKYEPEYLVYLDAESKKLTSEGKKEDAVKILVDAEKLVNDKEAVAVMLDEADSSIPAGGYILPYSDSRYLTEADISGLTIQEINYAKNEIYARHGRKFQSNELQTYFNGKAWYEGTIEASAFKESDLNVYEKKNAELLKEKEFSMESGGYKLDQ